MNYRMASIISIAIPAYNCSCRFEDTLTWLSISLNIFEEWLMGTIDVFSERTGTAVTFGCSVGIVISFIWSDLLRWDFLFPHTAADVLCASSSSSRPSPKSAT